MSSGKAVNQDFDWERPLLRSQGAPDRLCGLDVFHEIEWEDLAGQRSIQFKYGKCLAERVVRECPDGKKPALLLLDRPIERNTSFESGSLYVVVVDLGEYLASANPDASAAYFGDALDSGLTRMDQVENALGGLSETEASEVIGSNMNSGHIEDWTRDDPERVTALRTIAARVESQHPTGSGSGESDELSPEDIDRFRRVLADPDLPKVVEFIKEQDVLPAGLLRSVEHDRRCRAVAEFEAMLGDDLVEGDWQKWFETNDWVLGTEFVRVLDDRSVDVEHISDFLTEALDGFLDVVEIKRPGGSLHFWATTQDHGNLIPHTDLIRATTQSLRYVFEIEREAVSVKFTDRVGIRTIKPRSVLIFGRSEGWEDKEREAFRLLNSSFHNLTIMTYDHVLRRAKRTVGISD